MPRRPLIKSKLPPAVIVADVKTAVWIFPNRFSSSIPETSIGVAFMNTPRPRFSHQYVVDVITGSRDVSAHGPREMPVWEDRFGSVDSGAEAAAALWVQRRIDALATQVESLQVGVAPHDQR